MLISILVIQHIKNITSDTHYIQNTFFFLKKIGYGEKKNLSERKK